MTLRLASAAHHVRDSRNEQREQKQRTERAEPCGRCGDQRARDEKLDDREREPNGAASDAGIPKPDIAAREPALSASFANPATRNRAERRARASSTAISTARSRVG
jgi:hypothetical protein